MWYASSLTSLQRSYLALKAMYESCTFLVSGSLAAASASTLSVSVRRALITESGSGRAITPWFLIRSSMASLLCFWHQASLITLQAAAFCTMAFRSAGSLSQAALLISSSLTVADSCQPVV